MPKQRTLHIFRAGRQTTKAGDEIEFSASDLEACAKAYDPALHRAAICVGHPKSDGPAYGFIQRLQVEGSDLVAEPAKVEPQFAELVKDGRFLSVSAAFYAPDARHNPVPGVYYLRHVGFLGAEPPALKGLRPPEFAESDEGDDFVAFAEIEFSDPAFGFIARMFRGLRDHLIETLGLEKADQVLPEWGIGSIDELGRDRPDPRNPEGLTGLGPAFSERPPSTTPETHVSTEQLAKLQADLAAAQKTAKDATDALAANQREARQAEALAFAEGLVKSEQLLPRDKALVVSLLDAVEGGSNPIEFGEGDDKKPLGTALRDLLKALPKHGLNDQHLATKGKGAASLHDDPTALAARAVEFQEAQRSKGIVISTAEAVSAVMASAT